MSPPLVWIVREAFCRTFETAWKTMGWSAAVLVTLAEIVTSPPKTRMGPPTVSALLTVILAVLPALPNVKPAIADGLLMVRPLAPPLCVVLGFVSVAPQVKAEKKAVDQGAMVSVPVVVMKLPFSAVILSP